jgi:hypothetical protein
MGKLVHLILKDPKRETVEVDARVVHATLRPDNEWLLGCELLSRLNDNELEALLQ